MLKLFLNISVCETNEVDTNNCSRVSKKKIKGAFVFAKIY